MLWLDHLIFGNGHGLGSPYFDGRFYWLSGRLYTFLHGFGAQLHSFQWTHPLPGEVRKLSGREYRPFNSRRSWCRVMVSWATLLPSDIQEASAELREIEDRLGRFVRP